jgi:hypothetical protein
VEACLEVMLHNEQFYIYHVFEMILEGLWKFGGGFTTPS